MTRHRAALLAGGAALFLLARPFAAAEPAPKPPPPRLLVVGLDGADLRTLDRLLADGVPLPNFRKLMGSGWTAPVEAFDPVLSPPLWTTIATGRHPVDHGVWDFLEPGPTGAPIPVTSASRKVRALWNLAAEREVTTAVLGWYATWPAEKIRGAVVSDRLLAHQVGAAAGRPATGLTFPANLVESIDPLRPTDAEAMRAVRARFVAGEPPPGSAERLAELARSWQSAETLRRAFPLVLDRFRPEIALVYVDLPDAAGHLFADAAPPRLPEVSDADFAAFSGAWRATWIYLDELLGDLLVRAGPGTTVAVCSDHGFRDAADRPRRSGRVDTGMAGLWHRRDGLLILSGPATKRGGRSPRAVRVEDLFPTFAAAARLPLSAELPGRLLGEAFVEPPVPSTVPSYEATPRPAIAVPADGGGGDEAVKRLRALGYLGGSESVAPGKPGGRTARSHHHEGVWRMSRGELSQAAAKFREALAADGSLHETRICLATVLGGLGDLAAAEKALSEIPEGRETWQKLVSLAALDLERGEIAEAEQLMRKAAAVDDRDPALALLEARIALAKRNYEPALAAATKVIATAEVAADRAAARRVRAEALGKTGRREEAVRELEALLRSEPSAATAILLGDLRREAGERAGAIGAFEAAAKLDPGSPWPHLRLGLSRLEAGEASAARSSYAAAKERAPAGRPRELARLGLALAALEGGDAVAAREELEGAEREFPGSPELLRQLGTLDARERRWIGANRRLSEAARLAPSAPLLALLAGVRAAAGDRAGAVEAADRSLLLDPAQPQLRQLRDQLRDAPPASPSDRR